jgi:hypothetical protein
LVPLEPFGQSGDNDIVASVLPSFPNLFVEVETQTFTGPFNMR